MKHLLALVFLVSLPACGVAVEDPAPAPACGWVDDPQTLVQSCPAPFAYTSTERVEVLDDGAAVCRVFDEACGDCHRTHAECQPAGDARTGRP